MERAICLAIGYLFGLFQTGYLYSKAHHMDIRNYGSGNSGSTNVLRVMGVKAGFIVFLGDSFKTIFACLLTRYLFRTQPEMLYVYLLYTGFGVILGHNFPFYMGFKGGKGIAVVAVTRYVSLGSILVMILFSTGMIYFAGRGDFGIHEAAFPEFCLMAVVIALMGIWRHRTNIRRLLSGTENKLGAKKQ